MNLSYSFVSMKSVDCEITRKVNSWSLLENRAKLSDKSCDKLSGSQSVKYLGVKS